MYTLPDNPFEILDVSKNAQIPEIRTAYRKLVLKCHPDKVTDPTQKAIKAEEFQKVQKAYELLSNESERQKYEDMVRANELEKENAERRRQRDREFTPGRTPPRSYDSDHARSPHFTVHVKPEPTSYKVRTAEPPPFTKSSTWAPAGSKSPYTSTRTPPRSYEDMNNYSSYDDGRESRDTRESRRARKASVVYEEKLSSRHEDERRSKKKAAEEEYARQLEKARKKEQEKREKKEEEMRRIEKERRKEEKRRAEKQRDADRKRDSEDKRRHKVYVEEDVEPVILNASPPKSEKKTKSSSRVKEAPVVRETSENHYDSKLSFAAEYLETSRSKAPPGLRRAQTYHYNGAPAEPVLPAVATPPPAAAGVAPPPPMPSMAERLHEEDDEPVLRSSGRRRMSHDSPRVKEKTSSSSYKKSSPTKEAEYVESSRTMPSLKKTQTMPTSYSHQGTPLGDSPPKLSRAQTEYVRPAPGPAGMPSMHRNGTWAGEGVQERSSRAKPQYYSDDDSDDDPRPRRSRTARSPDEYNTSTSTYRVENGRAKPNSRSASYVDAEPPSSRRARTYYPEPNTSRPLEHRPAMTSHDSYMTQQGFKVKTQRSYGMDDVQYSTYPAAYRPNEAYGYA